MEHLLLLAPPLVLLSLLTRKRFSVADPNPANLVEHLLRLAQGVKAFDISTIKIVDFMLLLLCIGDLFSYCSSHIYHLSGVVQLHLVHLPAGNPTPAHALE